MVSCTSAPRTVSRAGWETGTRGADHRHYRITPHSSAPSHTHTLHHTVAIVGHTACGGCNAAFSAPKDGAAPGNSLGRFLAPLVKLRHSLPPGATADDLVKANVREGVKNAVASEVSELPGAIVVRAGRRARSSRSSHEPPCKNPQIPQTPPPTYPFDPPDNTHPPRPSRRPGRRASRSTSTAGCTTSRRASSRTCTTRRGLSRCVSRGRQRGAVAPLDLATKAEPERGLALDFTLGS